MRKVVEEVLVNMENMIMKNPSPLMSPNGSKYLKPSIRTIVSSQGDI